MCLHIIKRRFILSILVFFFYFLFGYLVKLSEELTRSNNLNLNKFVDKSNLEDSLEDNMEKIIKENNLEINKDEIKEKVEEEKIEKILSLRKKKNNKFKTLFKKIVKNIENFVQMKDELFDKFLDLPNIETLYPVFLFAVNEQLDFLFNLIKSKCTKCSSSQLFLVFICYEVLLSEIIRSFKISIKFPEFSHIIIRRAEFAAFALYYFLSYIEEHFVSFLIHDVSWTMFFFGVIHMIGFGGFLMSSLLFDDILGILKDGRKFLKLIKFFYVLIISSWLYLGITEYTVS